MFFNKTDKQNEKECIDALCELHDRELHILDILDVLYEADEEDLMKLAKEIRKRRKQE